MPACPSQMLCCAASRSDAVPCPSPVLCRVPAGPSSVLCPVPACPASMFRLCRSCPSPQRFPALPSGLCCAHAQRCSPFHPRPAGGALAPSLLEASLAGRDDVIHVRRCGVAMALFCIRRCGGHGPAPCSCSPPCSRSPLLLLLSSYTRTLPLPRVLPQPPARAGGACPELCAGGS